MRFFSLAALASAALLAQSPVGGRFEGQSDIGAVAHPGNVHFDEAKKSYVVTASGANMWTTFDEFHFVWKKIPAGDASITADIEILTPHGNNHRKGVLMMRQSLDADSAYVSAALHGDGLASIQSRPEKGANTYEVQSNASKSKTLRLVKRGEYVYLYTGSSPADLKFSGGSMRLKWTDPFYLGIGACAHDKEALVEVEFDHVHVGSDTAAAAQTERYSTIETVPFPSGDRRAVYATLGMLRGPTWDRDGGSLIVSHDGRLERAPVAGGKSVEAIATGKAPLPCDSFQGVSPDGKRLAATCGEKPSLYVVALDGSQPGAKRITHKIPTVFHGWSPDGKTLLYSIERKGMKHDFDRILSTGGGKETRLTNNGSSDNPEYSPDGKFIYFNSAQDEGAGTMQVWRIPANGGGGGPQQITNDEFNNWYPHLSPDGRRILVLSCDKDVKGPPEDREVLLRIFTLETGRFQITARVLVGGRGTIDSPAWSPDGRKIAFVTYQFLPVEGMARP